MAEINVRFDLKFSSRFLRLAMVGAMFLAAVPELASESVTLTTYYPAPSGVYTQLIGTSNTYVARDAGFLDVGTNTTLAAGNEMAVMGGRVGIGTTSPGNELEVVGAGSSNIDLAVNGRMQTGDASNAGGIWLSNSSNMFVGQDGTSVGFYTSGAGWSETLDQTGSATFVNNITEAGRLGTSGYSATAGYPGGWGGGIHTYDLYSEGSVGNGAAGSLLTYLSQGVSYAAYKVVSPETIESQTSCSEIGFPPNSNAPCAGYITPNSGIYSKFMTLPVPQGPTGPGVTTTYEVTALCCACPAGGGCDL